MGGLITIQSYGVLGKIGSYFVVHYAFFKRSTCHAVAASLVPARPACRVHVHMLVLFVLHLDTNI
jgi:hypothetical protein